MEQWDELALHLDVAKHKERCYTADQLSSLFKNKTNFLYMDVLSTYLKPITLVNTMFQASNADALKLLEEINNSLYTYSTVLVRPMQLQKTNKQCLFKFDFGKHTMDPTYMNFGYSFNEKSSGIKQEQLKDVKKRCKESLVEICMEIQKRLPNNTNNLENCKLMRPKNATNEVKPDITNLVKSFKSVAMVTLLSKNRMHYIAPFGNVQFKRRHSGSKFIPCKMQLVKEVLNQHIAKLAIGILSLQFFNSVVERPFSQFGIVKNELSNRLAIKTAEATVRIPYSLPKGCIHFVPTSRMLNKFNSEKNVCN